MTNYYYYLTFISLIFAVLTQSLQQSWFYSKKLNFVVTGINLMSAYLLINFIKLTGFNLFWTVLIVLWLIFIFGLVFFGISQKLMDQEFIVFSLAVNQAIINLSLNLTQFTGGAFGLAFTLNDTVLKDQKFALILVSLGLVAILLVQFLFSRSVFSKTIMAKSQSEKLTESWGLQVKRRETIWLAILATPQI
ncbi:MAG: hypothetical protein WCK98_07360 [bacterium]